MANHLATTHATVRVVLAAGDAGFIQDKIAELAGSNWSEGDHQSSC
jgi:hypothetical protein